MKIGFIVKAGSLTDLSKKERHKSSLGQLSSAAHSIGGSLLSIGSLEKRKGLKKLAKSIGNKVKGKSKTKLDKNGLDEREEHEILPSQQEPGEADPGVISEDEDEFTVRYFIHKKFNPTLLNISSLSVRRLVTQKLRLIIERGNDGRSNGAASVSSDHDRLRTQQTATLQHANSAFSASAEYCCRRGRMGSEAVGKTRK